jgi:hypothetical protein
MGAVPTVSARKQTPSEFACQIALDSHLTSSQELSCRKLALNALQEKGTGHRIPNHTYLCADLEQATQDAFSDAFGGFCPFARPSGYAQGFQILVLNRDSLDLVAFEALNRETGI